MNATLKYKFIEQPPIGIDVHVLAENCRRDPNGNRPAYQAMTVGQAEDTQWYSCPLGIEGDIVAFECGWTMAIVYVDATCDGTTWYWVVTLDDDESVVLK